MGRQVVQSDSKNLSLKTLNQEDVEGERQGKVPSVADQTVFEGHEELCVASQAKIVKQD